MIEWKLLNPVAGLTYQSDVLTKAGLARVLG